MRRQSATSHRTCRPSLGKRVRASEQTTCGRGSRMQFWKLLRCCGQVGGVTNLPGLGARNIFLVNEKCLVEEALRDSKRAAENGHVGKCFSRWSCGVAARSKCPHHFRVRKGKRCWWQLCWVRKQERERQNCSTSEYKLGAATTTTPSPWMSCTLSCRWAPLKRVWPHPPDTHT